MASFFEPSFIDQLRIRSPRHAQNRNSISHGPGVAVLSTTRAAPPHQRAGWRSGHCARRLRSSAPPSTSRARTRPGTPAPPQSAARVRAQTAGCRASAMSGCSERVSCRPRATAYWCARCGCSIMGSVSLERGFWVKRRCLDGSHNKRSRTHMGRRSSKLCKRMSIAADPSATEPHLKHR